MVYLVRRIGTVSMRGSAVASAAPTREARAPSFLFFPPRRPAAGEGPATRTAARNVPRGACWRSSAGRCC
eukprot:scaffold23205_cov99-Isochrysis_galbana.AAC.3